MVRVTWLSDDSPVREDFAFSVGKSEVLNRRPARDGGWEEFAAVQTVTSHLGGKVLIEEIEFLLPSGDRPKGVAVFAHDDETNEWSYVWLNERAAPDFRPMKGRLADGVIEMFGEDEDEQGNRQLLRFRWTDITETSARWEQAVSADGATWEANWTQEIQQSG